MTQLTQLTQLLCSEKESCVNLVSTCADPDPKPTTCQVRAVRMPAG